MRDVFLPFRGERYLVPRAAAEGDDYYLPLIGRDTRSSDQAGGQQGTAQRHPRGSTQKFAAAAGELACGFLGSGCFRGGPASPALRGLPCTVGTPCTTGAFPKNHAVGEPVS